MQVFDGILMTFLKFTDSRLFSEWCNSMVLIKNNIFH